MAAQHFADDGHADVGDAVLTSSAKAFAQAASDKHDRNQTTSGMPISNSIAASLGDEPEQITIGADQAGQARSCAAPPTAVVPTTCSMIEVSAVSREAISARAIVVEIAGRKPQQVLDHRRAQICDHTRSPSHDTK